MIEGKDEGIILLSGGLDSVVALAQAVETIDVKLALTFDYGQKSFQKEFEAAKNVAKHYSLEHEVVKLDWLKNITRTALVSGEEVPNVDIETLEDKEATTQSKNKVWVPNRNGLFIHIAAAYADARNYKFILIGANKEEAQTFSDNSERFIKDINKSLETSTGNQVHVVAPSIHFNKEEIIKAGLSLKAPLHFINSCYNNTPKHCGRCESCNRLKRALQNLEKEELIKNLFEG